MEPDSQQTIREVPLEKAPNISIIKRVERLPGMPNLASAIATTPQGLYVATGYIVLRASGGPVAVLPTTVKNMSYVGNASGWGIVVLGWDNRLYFLSPSLKMLWSVSPGGVWSYVYNAGGYIALIGDPRGTWHYLQVYDMEGRLVGDFWAPRSVYNDQGRVLIGNGTVLWAASTSSMSHDIIVYDFHATPLFQTNTSMDGLSMMVLDAYRVGDGYLVVLGGYSSGNRTAILYYSPRESFTVDAGRIFGCNEIGSGSVVASAATDSEVEWVLALECASPEDTSIIAWYRLSLATRSVELLSQASLPTGDFMAYKGRDRIALLWGESEKRLIVARLDGEILNITIPYNIGYGREASFVNGSLLVFHEDGWDHVLVDTDTGETMLLARKEADPASSACCGYISLPGGVYHITEAGLQPVEGLETVRGYTASPIEPGVLFRVRLLDNWSLRLERLRNGTLEASAMLPVRTGEPVPLVYSGWRGSLYVLASGKILEYDPDTLELRGESDADVSPWIHILSIIDGPWATALLEGGSTGIRLRTLFFESAYRTPLQIAASQGGEWQAISWRGDQSRGLVLVGMNGEAINLCAGLCLARWISQDVLAYLEISHRPGTMLHLFNTSSNTTQNISVGAVRLAFGEGFVLLMDHNASTLTLITANSTRSLEGVVDAYPYGPGQALALLPNGTVILASTNGSTTSVGSVLASGITSVSSTTGITPGPAPLVVVGGVFFMVVPFPARGQAVPLPSVLPAPVRAVAGIWSTSNVSVGSVESLEVALFNLTTGQQEEAFGQSIQVTLRYPGGMVVNLTVQPQNGIYTFRVGGALAVRIEAAGSSLIIPLQAYAEGKLDVNMRSGPDIKAEVAEHNLTHILVHAALTTTSPSRLLYRADLVPEALALYEWLSGPIMMRGTNGSVSAYIALAGESREGSCPLPCSLNLNATIPLNSSAMSIVARATGTLLVNASGEGVLTGFLGLDVETGLAVTLHIGGNFTVSHRLDVRTHPENASSAELYLVEAGGNRFIVAVVRNVPWLGILENPSPSTIIDKVLIDGSPVGLRELANATLALYKEDTYARYVTPCDTPTCILTGSIAIALDPSKLGIGDVTSIALRIHIHLENTTLKDLHYWANTTLTSTIMAPANMTPFLVAMRLLENQPIPPPSNQTTTTPPSTSTQSSTHPTETTSKTGEAPVATTSSKTTTSPTGQEQVSAPRGPGKALIIVSLVLIILALSIILYWKRAG